MAAGKPWLVFIVVPVAVMTLAAVSFRSRTIVVLVMLALCGALAGNAIAANSLTSALTLSGVAK